MIVKIQPDEYLNYLGDTSGIKAGRIEGVWIAESASDVSEILTDANKNRIPVTVSGNGTGTTGGRVPLSGRILATDKLTAIGEVVRISRTEARISVGAGVLLKDVQETVLQAGWMYPPDPTERNAFIGGTISTNASGARSFRYGATRNWVNAIDLVLPDGFELTIRRGQHYAANGVFSFSEKGRDFSFVAPTYQMPPVKHAAGYYSHPDMDFIDLFIGSEGTLGVITGAELKLIPKPAKQFSGILFFPDETRLMNFTFEAISISRGNAENPDQPSASSIEFFDYQSLIFLKGKYPQTPDHARGAIYFEQECTVENEDRLLDFWFNLASTHGALTDDSWFAQTPAEDQFFKEYRHALPALINEFLSRNGVKKISSDIAVPGNHFPDMMKLYHQVLDNSPFRHVIFGHIGDFHLHMNILPHNETEHAEGKKVYKNFIDSAIAMGGTISAEHGVGKLKVNYLMDMYGKEGIAQMASVKTYFDPNGILGRGTLIPEDFLP